jgi:hypothetical protein
MIRSSIVAFLLSTTLAKANTLVLVLDMSGSVTPQMQQLQIDSYAATLYDIRGLLGSTYIEVIGFGSRPELFASGRVLDVVEQLQNFKGIDESDRDDPFALIWQSFDSATCIGLVFDYIIQRYPSYTGKVMIDFSADGKDNCGVPPVQVQTKANILTSFGATINVLPIPFDGEPDIVSYLETYVMSPDGFSIVFDGTLSIEEAIYNKVSLEVSYFLKVD